MYQRNDFYYEIPALYFQLVKDKNERGDYEKIKNSVKSFKGNLEWRCGPSAPSRKNYEIIPKIARITMDNQKSSYDDYLNYKNLTDQETFERICDLAIEDIPNLYEHMKKTL
ncbi:hypothetical protein RV06_GL002279 [Enterococcus haemoperoxidus]|nr:hypothetical protein RV06_GL002279 [Enterococcus haemoperoxidus]